MKKIAVIVSFLAWALIAGMTGSAAQKAGVNPIVAELGFLTLTVALAFAPRKRSGDMAADVAVEQWVNYIIERLWKKNKFLETTYNDDQYVIGGKIVHIPQPGAATTVNKNNASYPVAAVQRTDTDVTYTLDNYTTVPTHIPDVDLAQISYDKTMSIIEDHFGYLLQAVGDDMIYKWLNGMTGAATNIVRTTGDPTAVTISGQTGNRLAMTDKDLQTARLKLNLMNVPEEDRYALIQSDMLQQLINSLSATQYRDFSREYDAKEGTVGRLYGFNIMERSTTGTIQDSVGGGVVANDFLTAAGATDQVACLCYHKNFITRALGERKMFQRIGDPLYYGDIYSVLLRAGGRRRRGDDNGIVAIVQAAATAS
jgi:hypothetical protein